MKFYLTLSVVTISIIVDSCNGGAPRNNILVAEDSTQKVDSSFLDSLSLHTFHYFWDLAELSNGNIPDRWPTESFSSIAATGFGLTCYLVGIDRGYISRQQGAERALKTLLFFANAPKGDSKAGITGNHGFFYHFIDMKTGLRFKDVELSTIDTGLLMAGILSCQTYFDGENDTEREIRELADSLYRGVQWNWAMNGGKTMSMGWHPESGFLDVSWKGYNEAMILYILALGSPTYPVPPSAWEEWTKTYLWAKFNGQDMINFGPLFAHQYSQMYIDFRGIRDSFMRSKGIDYFENSRRATYSNRTYCSNNPAGFDGYSETIWGLTACDGPGNSNNVNPNISFMDYAARGAAKGNIVDDGTIAPTATGGSVAFAPEICIPALENMYRKYGDKIYDRYGFKDAFNLSFLSKDGIQGWVDVDYLGIDEGPIVIQLENYRCGLIWDLMKKNKYIVTGLKKAGFTGGWLEQ
ncbi:MAG: Tat pathway signal protein [Chitinophagales bacterium]|nr:Tat pathway signal protein [Chitinophagales bacterium]